MLCNLPGIILVAICFVIQPPGFEVDAVIRKIDTDKRIAEVFANGKERTVQIADDVKTLDEAGKNLSDGLSATELKVGAKVTLRVEPRSNTPTIVTIRLGGRVNGTPGNNGAGQMSVGKNSVGFKPLTEMTASDRYKDEDGGLYGGYADGRLNPEPYAYEGAFVVRWLIRSQSEADTELNYDRDRGDVKSPLLLWGPYFWADGITPRKGDGLVWERSDLVADGTHPSDSGRQKVAEQLLNFFKTNVHTKTWFVKR